MSLTAAQLEAILTLDKSQFDRQMRTVNQDMAKSEGGFKSWGKGVGGAINDGVVLAATGAAGFAATITAVGVEYNALQQSSRAALDTILGGVDKANEQMDKLNEFASNSPFARDVFIRAQQQLLGFGMEAEKVVPTLEAIQDAVAATGGSNEDIAGLADVLAKVEGTGKITAQTLNQLGYRGVDAATIIGEQMGKTGNQIRDEITAGTLDAGEAMDALTTGMTERFGGAAANVKETWLGATDRIKAATRDIGAEIARPFVDPMGGGRAIDWANDFADVLRAVERQVPSLVTVLDNRLSPSFDRFRISMKDAVDEIDSWDASDLEGILDRLGQHTPAIAGLSAAMFTMATSNIPVIGGLTSALGPLPAALGAAALASPEVRDGLKDLYEAGEPLIGVLGDLAGVASGTFTAGLQGAGEVLGFVGDVVGPVVEWFADLPEPIRNAATAALIFNAAGGPTSKVLTGMTDGAKNFAGGIQNALSSFDPWKGRFQGAAAEALTFRTKLRIVQDEAGGFGGMIRNVAGDLGKSATTGLRGALHGIMGIFGGPWGIALMGATAAITLWAQEQQKAKQYAQELSSSLDEQTGALTKNSEELVLKALQDEISADTLERMGISLADVTEAALGNADAMQRVREAVQADTDAKIEALPIDEGYAAASAAIETQNGKVIKSIENQIDVIEEEQREKRALIEAEEERYRLMDEGERAYVRYQEAMEIVVDETINMNDRVRALNDALDELNGVSKTQEERDRELAATQRDLGSWFEDNAEAIGEMDEALIDMSDGIPSKTELGDQLNRMLRNMSDEAHQAALEARDVGEAAGDSSKDIQAAVAEAYAPYIDTLQDLADQGYLTQEEVDALTESIIGVPEVTSFVITHGDKVTQAELDVINLIDKIESTPDGDFVISDEETTQDAIDELKDLGYTIEETPDGEFKITPVGIDAAEEIINDFVNKPRSINILANIKQGSVDKNLEEARSGGTGWGIVAPRYHGGIDIRGMAAGGLTGASVMDFAQMVAPGDIRFAGDRSDVDEAWIPLDGSARSIAILNEAIARMPGYDPAGMAAGGIDGVLTPPTVEAVDGPDTSELETVWQDAMTFLEDTTRATFATIETDTAASQDATTKTTSDQLAAMQSVTANQFALMAATTATNMATMDADTTRHTASMRETAAQEFLAMQQTGANQTALLHAQAASAFQALHADGARETAGLRASSNAEFTAMQTHGITAASDLRAGIVSEIGAARTPFAGNVNDLVDVMRSFSDALNKAYGDMGVDVGKPSRISAATGAILPGWNPGVDNHIFHSPTGGILELSGGEGVSRPEVVQAMGAGTFNALNAAARTGGVSAVQRLLGGSVPRRAYAGGGIMDDFLADARAIGTEHKGLLPDTWLKPAGRNIIDTVIDGMNDMLSTMFSGDGWVRPTTGLVTSPYGAGRGAYPHAGMDIAKGEGVPVVAPTAMRILETGWNIGPGRTGLGILGELMDGMWSYFGHNPVGGIRVKPGDLVAPGQQIGAQGNTGNSTGAHLHWEIHQGAPWRDINPHPFWEAAGGAPGAGGALPSGSNDMWTGIIAQALGLVGLPRTPAYVNAWLRQGKSESGLNPRAVQGIRDINSITGNHARGIVQVIPPTFAAYSLPGMKDIFNPLHNFAAGMNYAKNRYGVTGMLGVIGRGHGYEHGTESAVPGWAWVGEAGPELIRFRGGEQVMSNRDSMAAVGGINEDRLARKIAHEFAKVAPSGPVMNINDAVTDNANEFARTMTKTFQRRFGKMAGV